MDNTGSRIKQARIAARLTQEELANKIGVKFSAIHKYESGLVVNLKRSTIASLSKALNVKPSWLMCMDEDGPENENTPTLTIEDERTIEFINLFSQLSEAEQDIFLAQIKGVLASR